jgi:hypothetical protein
MSDERRKKRKGWGPWLGMGIAIGTGLGVTLENFAIGIAISLAIGVALYARLQREDDLKPPEEVI